MASNLDIACVLEPDGFFRAIDRNNYDVDCDQDGFFSNSPTGYGRTPLNAIVDLLDATDIAAAKKDAGPWFPRTSSRSIIAKTYYNPTKVGNVGWMAYDDHGNYSFGDTEKEARDDFKREDD